MQPGNPASLPRPISQRSQHRKTGGTQPNAEMTKVPDQRHPCSTKLQETVFEVRSHALARERGAGDTLFSLGEYDPSVSH